MVYPQKSGKYTVTTVKGNNVRTSYNTTATITGVLPNGTSIIYDCLLHKWLSLITYIANNGKRRYITGEVDKDGKRLNSFGKFSAV